MAKVSFDVVRMRACYGKTSGKFVSLIVYNYEDDQTETEVKITKNKLTVTFEESDDSDEAKAAKKALQKSRFLYPDHKDFSKVVNFGKTHDMLPADFTV